LLNILQELPTPREVLEYLIVETEKAIVDMNLPPPRPLVFFDLEIYILDIISDQSFEELGNLTDSL
jgi:hypothetical protein